MSSLNGLTVVQLKERLRAKGLPVSGRKADLIERLSRSRASEVKLERPRPSEVKLERPRPSEVKLERPRPKKKDLAFLTVVELKTLLRAKNLPVGGNKAELVARLTSGGRKPSVAHREAKTRKVENLPRATITVKQLKIQLRIKGLSVTGNKAQLAARLMAAGGFVKTVSKCSAPNLSAHERLKLFHLQREARL
jgi:hypothetical protein